jgi:hypothetical protein
MFQVDVGQRQVWRHLGKLRRLHRREQCNLLGLLRVGEGVLDETNRLIAICRQYGEDLLLWGSTADMPTGGVRTVIL